MAWGAWRDTPVEGYGKVTGLSGIREKGARGRAESTKERTGGGTAQLVARWRAAGDLAVGVGSPGTQPPVGAVGKFGQQFPLGENGSAKPLRMR